DERLAPAADVSSSPPEARPPRTVPSTARAQGGRRLPDAPRGRVLRRAPCRGRLPRAVAAGERGADCLPSYPTRIAAGPWEPANCPQRPPCPKPPSRLHPAAAVLHLRRDFPSGNGENLPPSLAVQRLFLPGAAPGRLFHVRGGRRLADRRPRR